MAPLFALILAFVAQLVSAHWELDYPYWRGNSFKAPASQWIHPCEWYNSEGFHVTLDATFY
jgi:hypothetical protein